MTKDFVLSQEAQNVLASMAIENMFFDEDFLNKISAIEKGELSCDDVRKEIIQDNAR